MIPTTQREALAVLAELCEMSPDVRLGQLLAVLYHHRQELAARSSAPNPVPALPNVVPTMTGVPPQVSPAG